MRVVIASIFVLPVFLASCQKHILDLPNERFDYSVSVNQEIKIPANDFAWFGGQIKVLTGNPSNEPVAVSFEGTPANVLVIANTPGPYKANCGFTDSFSARNATVGTYPMKIVFTNASTGVRKYDFNLVVTDPVDHRSGFTGNYQPSGNCGYDIYVSCQIQLVPTTQQLRIIDRHSSGYYDYGTFDTSYADIDCCTNTFVIPSQVVKGTTVYGRGYLTTSGGSKSIIIERHFSNDSLNYPCTVTLGN